MNAPDPAWVEAAVQALRQCDPGYDLEDDFHLPTLAGRLIAAVEPLIREHIAQQIEARTEVHSGMDIKCDFCIAFRSAAAIARGQS